MLSTLSRTLITLSLFFFLSPAVKAAPLKDVPGGRDHPMVSRYADSIMIGYKLDKFDEAELVLGPATYRDGKRGFEKSRMLQGQRTRLLYVVPKDRSSLEVMKNYEEALAKAGFATLYTCSRAQCGTQMAAAIYFSPQNPRQISGKQLSEYAFSMRVEDERLLTAKLARPSGDVYVTVFAAMQENASNVDASHRVAVFVEVVEVKPMQGNMVTVDAAAMQKGLASEGKIAIYGIYFDYDKADIKPESKPQLDEMAALLKNNPKLKVFIVGHSDNQGQLDYNLSLSQRRAEAVAKALAQQGINAQRLVAKGVANLAPVSSNAGEDGRARNRRVELVEQ